MFAFEKTTVILWGGQGQPTVTKRKSLSKFWRGFVGYGGPASLLDAANYAKEE